MLATSCQIDHVSNPSGRSDGLLCRVASSLCQALEGPGASQLLSAERSFPTLVSSLMPCLTNHVANAEGSMAMNWTHIGHEVTGQLARAPQGVPSFSGCFADSMSWAVRESESEALACTARLGRLIIGAFGALHPRLDLCRHPSFRGCLIFPLAPQNELSPYQQGFVQVCPV